MFSKTINYDVVNLFLFSEGPTEYMERCMKKAANELIDRTKNLLQDNTETNYRLLKSSLLYFQRLVISLHEGRYMVPFLIDMEILEVKEMTNEDLLDFAKEFNDNYAC